MKQEETGVVPESLEGAFSMRTSKRIMRLAGLENFKATSSSGPDVASALAVAVVVSLRGLCSAARMTTE